MLTPPGLKGKQYRISGKAYPRLSRPGQKRRRVFQILGVVVALAVLGVGTVELVSAFGAKKKQTAAGHACPATQHQSAAGSDAASGRPSPAASGSAAAGPGAGASAGAGASVSPIALPSGVPQPSTITVNVFNATGRAGLAGQTAAQLRLRGFKIGKIANAPTALEGKIAGAAQVTGGTAARQAMALVGSEVSGATSTTDTRTDGSVDLVIGNGFTALLTPAQAAQTLALAVAPSPTASGHC